VKPPARWFPVEVSGGRRAGVRDARPSDARAALAGVSRVVKERPRTLLVSEGELWTPRQWRDHRLAWTPEGTWFVAELDGDFVGMYAIHRGPRRAERHVAEFGVWLLPEVRGMGFGRALLTAGEAWAREHGVSRIELSVFAGNERAQRCYLAAGYVIEGRKRRAFILPEGDVIDSITMAKLL
jgi:RimJ/RimL family protein N-acetyltransferase